MTTNLDQIIIDNMYKKMVQIRRLEETLLDLFSKGKIFGTTHTSIGQEAIAVSLLTQLVDGDVVFSNHRCHGHFLAYGGSLESIIAEVMGRNTGVVGGRGGSQHICYKQFYTNGIQGGIVGNAAGAALSHKLNNNDNIAVVFLGDGTLGEGLVYEVLNISSLWSLPILFVLENNRYAQSTPVELGVSGSMLERPLSFGIKADHVDSNDAIELYSIFERRLQYVRQERRPFFQIVDTYRFAPHSKGDDYRDSNEIEKYRLNDPIMFLQNKVSGEYRSLVEREVDLEIKNSLEKASKSEYLSIVEIELDSTMSNWKGIESQALVNNQLKNLADEYNGNLGKIRAIESINNALHFLLDNSDNVVVVGEDILDPYGGAFKATKGLSIKHPERVLTTPISEAAITALGTGLAMHGKRPVLEIMFGDFMALGADQLLNHATKYQWMYNNKVQVPLVIRTPMGGKRGYGPTHSQSIEKLFLGIPGLTVVAPSIIHDPGKLLVNAVLKHQGPVLFIENKATYSEYLKTINNGRFDDFFVEFTEGDFPTAMVSLDPTSNSDITIVCYGGSVPVALEVARTLLIEEEILLNIVVPSLLTPNCPSLVEMCSNTKMLVTVEEGTYQHGWGASIIAELAQNLQGLKFARFAAPNCPIPSSKPLEVELLPNAISVIEGIRRMYRE